MSFQERQPSESRQSSPDEICGSCRFAQTSSGRLALAQASTELSPDPVVPPPDQGAVEARTAGNRLPGREWRLLFPKAPHFSFVAPIPESVGKSLAGTERFDRAAFHEEMSRRTALHEEMNRRLVTFFKQAFSDSVEN